MPNITVYISKEIYDQLKKHPDLNKSAIVSKALKQAIARKEKKP